MSLSSRSTCENLRAPGRAGDFDLDQSAFEEQCTSYVPGAAKPEPAGGCRTSLHPAHVTMRAFTPHLQCGLLLLEVPTGCPEHL